MPTSNETYIYPDPCPQQQQTTKMRSPNSIEQNRTESMKDLADCVEQNGGLRGYLSNESIQCSNNNNNNNNNPKPASINVNTTMSSMNDITMTSDQHSSSNSITGGGVTGSDGDRDGGGVNQFGKKFSKTNYSTHNHPHHHQSQLHQNGNASTGAEKMSRTNLYIKGLPENFDDEQLWQLPPDQTKIKSVKAATDEDTKCREMSILNGKFH
ncbi:hypothetical protein MS3_00005000 [Schistosoma haematobium]|uniref:Uncharacterized protein n=2 Tax=Schistosoma haematobium TaxID=6185 RepID=A0A922IW29_SCHHA|nr:hypothetical protein MS3_00005000 [Schistosoma haematobium]KAH9587162.1 hypothetical protein MS3_00005000 [Schistosoma haematobium]